MTDISHISACRKAWLKHLANCVDCMDWVWIHNGPVRKCPTGTNLYDELTRAIECHRDLEYCEGTSCSTPTK